LISQTNRETSAFDRTGSSGLTARHEDRRPVVNTLIIVAVFAFIAYWWFGLR